MEKNTNKIFKLNSYLAVKGTPEEIVEKIVDNIPESDNIGFAGCLEKKWLKKLLERFIPDKTGNNQPYLYDSKYENEIKGICEETIKKCEKFIDKKIHIFLFPTFDKFDAEKMGGVNGFSSWDNTILIFINFVKGWEESLKETIVHELAHAISPFYKGGDFTIGEGLILEGLAEHFKDFIIKARRSSWTKAISKAEAEKILKEIKATLNEKDFDKYSEIFYGTGKYPNWAGYTIGYYLIKDYFKNNGEKDWNKLLRKDPKKIFKEILPFQIPL